MNNYSIGINGEDYIIEADDMTISDDAVYFYIDNKMVFIAYKKNLDYIRILQPNQVTLKPTYK